MLGCAVPANGPTLKVGGNSLARGRGAAGCPVLL